MKNKKGKFNEASTTAQIRGFLASRKAFANAELYDGKKNKNKKRETPWYMKTVKEVKELVREDIAERKRLVTEAGKLPDIHFHLKSLKSDLAKVQKLADADPGDDRARRAVASISNQIANVEKAIASGDPTGEKKRAAEKAAAQRAAGPAEPGGQHAELAQSIIDKFESDRSKWPEDKEHAMATLLKNLKKYTGALPASQGEKDKIESFISNRLVKQHDGDVTDYLAAREKTPFKRKAKGVDPTRMKTKTGKRAASMPADARAASGKRDKGPDMPGAAPSMEKLFQKLSGDPEHERSPFSPPRGSGKGYDPGAGGNILKKVYNKLIKGDPEKALKGMVDPSRFGDIDPEALGIKKQEWTEFEKALGPYLRNLYKKKGYKMDEPEDPSVSRAAGASNVLKFMLSKVMGVKKDDVEKVAQEKSDSEWESIEQQALGMLQKQFPNEYEKEMAMRDRRNKATAEMDAEEDRKTISVQDMEDALTARMGAPLTELDPEAEKIKQTNPEEWESMVRRLYSRQISSPQPRKRDPEPERETPGEYTKIKKALAQAVADKKGPRKGASTKAKRRAYARSFDEPRDPEDLARRREMEPTFKASGAAAKRRREQEKLKKDRLELIKQRHQASLERDKAVGESFKFNITELFEGFENSYDVDADAPEEEWEDAKIPAKKHWTKELSLESLYNKLKEAAHDKQRQLRGDDPQKWLDNEGEHSEELSKVNTPDGWGKGNESSAWLTVGKHAGRLGKDVGKDQDNEREEKVY